MAANYYVKNDKAIGKFLIIESSSKLVIEAFDNYSLAKKKAKHYNDGGGFAGHTPPFIVRKVK